MSCLDQPASVEIKIADGLFIKSMEIAKAGTFVPQHSHEYQHVTMIAKGSFRVWKDDVLLGDFKAPHGLIIEAKTMHRFLSLEDECIAYCIHNIKDAEAVEIHEENALRDQDFEYLRTLKDVA